MTAGFACRIIRPPFSATPTSARPLPRVRRPQARMGLAFEKKVQQAIALALASAGESASALTSNPWFAFVDSAGPGLAALDATLTFGSIGLCIEVKYTWVPEAAIKLSGLYLPVLRAVRPNISWRGLIICKNLTPTRVALADSITHAFRFPESTPPTLQWLGSGPIAL